MKMSEYVIGIDVGGTRIKSGLVTPDGKLTSTKVQPANANEGTSQLYESLKKYIRKTKTSCEAELLGVGLSLSGGIDPEKGVVLLPGKFKNLEGFSLVPKLKKEFNVPVLADNDGRLAVYSEKYYGAAKDKDWAVVLTIGTGIGSGVILDGKILHDPHLQFGTQMGHVIMNKDDDKLCITGNNGTGETHCSANALALQVRGAIQRGRPSLLTDTYHKNPLDINFKRIIEAVKEGDKLCKNELDKWIDNLSILLVNAVHCYAPETIILSGGATIAADLFLSKLSKKVNEQIFRYPKEDKVEIAVSEFQEYSGVRGAAAYLLEHLNRV